MQNIRMEKSNSRISWFGTMNEDIVYSFFRLVMYAKGYLFRVKRTGYIEIDNIFLQPAPEQRKKGLTMHISFREKRRKIFFVSLSWNQQVN